MVLDGMVRRQAQEGSEMEERFLAQRNDPDAVAAHAALLKQQKATVSGGGHQQGEGSSSTAAAVLKAAGGVKVGEEGDLECVDQEVLGAAVAASVGCVEGGGEDIFGGADDQLPEKRTRKKSVRRLEADAQKLATEKGRPLHSRRQIEKQWEDEEWEDEDEDEGQERPKKKSEKKPQKESEQKPRNGKKKCPHDRQRSLLLPWFGIVV